jgi:hypothetical protein
MQVHAARLSRVAVCPDHAETGLSTHGFEKVELAGMSFVFKVDGIIAAEASIAKTPTLAVEISVHPLPTEIGKSVGLDEAADLFHRA